MAVIASASAGMNVILVLISVIWFIGLIIAVFSIIGIGFQKSKSAPQKPFCKYCGNPLKENDKFCGKCGAALEVTDAKAPVKNHIFTKVCLGTLVIFLLFGLKCFAIDGLRIERNEEGNEWNFYVSKNGNKYLLETEDFKVKAAVYELYNDTIPENVTIGLKQCPVAYLGTYADNDVLKINLNRITIPGNITGIRCGAFEECTSLEQVVIAEGVTYIDDYAFSRCTNLQYVEIPESVTDIGRDAFEGTPWRETHGDVLICNGIVVDAAEDLIEYQIPDGVTKIGDSAFEDCVQLERIYMPSSVTEIGRDAFANCIWLEDITFSDNLISIGEYAFDETPWLLDQGNMVVAGHYLYAIQDKDKTGYHIPDHITVIGNGAFSDCRYLKEIVLPESLIKIGERAFENCCILGEIVIPDSVIRIEEDAFSACTCLKNIQISANCTYIGEHAFSKCYLLKEVTIPAKVETIDHGAFMHCGMLERVTIEDGVKRLGDSVFYGCELLEEIVIPDSVVEIGDNTATYER